MNLKLSIFYLLLFIPLTFFGQKIQRRAYLGVKLESISDTLSKDLLSEKQNGVLVKRVYSNTSAFKAGIKSGDIISKINGDLISSKHVFIQKYGHLYDGDSLVIDFVRSGKTKQVGVKLRGKPLEKREIGRNIYGNVNTALGNIRTILTIPEQGNNFPLIFYIQGYTNSSIDNLYKHSPYNKIIDDFVNSGFAVLRIEKLGVGDSKAYKSKDEIDFHEEVSTFQSVYNSLSKLDYINNKEVYILGVSMGGVIAPMIKQKIPAKGIIVFGTVARPWFEYFVEQSRVQRVLIGESYLDNEKKFPKRLGFYYDYLVKKLTPRELAQIPGYKNILAADWSNDGKSNLMDRRNYKYWQQLQDNKPYSAWASVTSHVLSIWGASDFVSFSKDDHVLIRDIVNKYHPEKATFLQLQNIDHAFMKVKNQRESLNYWGDWNYYKENYNSDFVRAIVSWIRGLK
ncbi:MAG: alpha/beta fold hydrolase [Bacteroidales bacterium]